jgi:hypothetical protein
MRSGPTKLSSNWQPDDLGVLLRKLERRPLVSAHAADFEAP